MSVAEEDFLSRWSRRKTEARDPAREEPKPAGPAAAATTPAVPAAGPPAAPLPPVESLTPQSDFAPFMAPEVDGDLRRKALKTLFSDPHFNVMDMMDVYVDDYSKPDPLPDSWLDKLEQVSRLGDRAGRDREEAERRRALAQAGPAGRPVQEAAGEKASAPPEATAEPPQPAVGPPPAEDPNPPLPSGESGT